MSSVPIQLAMLGQIDRQTGPSSETSSPGMVSSVAGFGENLLTLAELQTRLTAIELRQNLDFMKNGVALIGIGAVLAVCSLPVIMAGVAELLVSELAIKRGYALLITSLASLAVAALLVAIARSWLIKKPLGFPLAGEEFTRNVSWLRTILRHSGRWPAKR